MEKMHAAATHNCLRKRPALWTMAGGINAMRIKVLLRKGGIFFY